MKSKSRNLSPRREVFAQGLAVDTDTPQAVWMDTLALSDRQIALLNTPQPAQDWRNRSRPTSVQRHERLTFVADLL